MSLDSRDRAANALKWARYSAFIFFSSSRSSLLGSSETDPLFVVIRSNLLRSPNQTYRGSLRRYLPNHSTSAKVILDEEDLWVDREHHLTLLAAVVSLGHLQRPLDALSH